MDQFISESGTRFVGLDLGDRWSHVYVTDEQGEVVEEGRVRTTPAALRERFEGRARMRVVMEAGTHSPWMSRLLSELAHEVVVANPRQLGLISSNDSKSDRVDAELLCRLGRVDVGLLRPIEPRSARAMAARALLRSRDVAVRTRTTVVNHLRGLVKTSGARLPRSSTPAFAKKTQMAVPEELQSVVAPLYELLAQINQAIGDYDRAIELAGQAEWPATEIMRQVAGVGPVTALAFVACVERPERFASSRAVGSYLGMRPRRDQSGARDPELRITKAGDPFVRRLLILSSQYILGPHGPDTDLRRFGQRLTDRGGKAAKRRAVVAVARKLAVLLHRLWVTGEVYEPLRQATRSEVVEQTA
jgi:transposase